jgi:hypothetical protein
LDHSEPIDVSAPAVALCAALGLDPDVVKSITLTRNAAIVVAYKTRKSGHKYLNKDGSPAMYAREFKVRT